MKTKTSRFDNIVRAPKTKHVPQRTCIACRRTRGKREMLRLVCTADLVEVDLKGKKPGRGVYICPLSTCWETGLKGNRIDYVLHARLSPENRQTLLEYGRSLPEKED